MPPPPPSLPMSVCSSQGFAGSVRGDTPLLGDSPPSCTSTANRTAAVDGWYISNVSPVPRYCVVSHRELRVLLAREHTRTIFHLRATKRHRPHPNSWPRLRFNIDMPGPREAILGSINRPAYKLPSRSTSYASSAPGARASTAPEPRAHVSDLLQEDSATWWRRTAAREFDDNSRPRDVGALHAEINAHPLAKKSSTTNIMGPRGGSLFTKHRYGNKRHCPLWVREGQRHDAVGFLCVLH